jgi:hypothetical protein
MYIFFITLLICFGCTELSGQDICPNRQITNQLGYNQLLISSYSANLSDSFFAKTDTFLIDSLRYLQNFTELYEYTNTINLEKQDWISIVIVDSVAKESTSINLDRCGNHLYKRMMDTHSERSKEPDGDWKIIRADTAYYITGNDSLLHFYKRTNSFGECADITISYTDSGLPELIFVYDPQFLLSYEGTCVRKYVYLK